MSEVYPSPGTYLLTMAIPGILPTHLSSVNQRSVKQERVKIATLLADCEVCSVVMEPIIKCTETVI